jgi:hypothetical protein
LKTTVTVKKNAPTHSAANFAVNEFLAKAAAPPYYPLNSSGLTNLNNATAATLPKNDAAQ